MKARSAATLAVLFVLALAFWDTALLYPLKAFVVLLHELGHGLAAVLTGGRIERIDLSPNLGGVCWSRGGWRLLVLPAGYLGSMGFGALILITAARSRHDRLLSALIGVTVLVVTLLFVRTLFGLLFGALFGLGMLAVAWLLPLAVNDLLLKFLGLTSMLYAVIDIKEDLISRTVPGSDAYAMAQILPLPPVLWGVLWIVVAVVGALLAIRVASRSPGSR
jgi:hypothetical protein